jgi:hypothetical protein
LPRCPAPPFVPYFGRCFSPLSRPFLVMDSQNKGTKRARTQQQDGAGASDNLPGREQLLLSSPELQTRLGRKYCDETELLAFTNRARLCSPSSYDSDRGEAAGWG